MIENERIELLVLPWAKEHHRQKYDLTIQVSRNAKAYRAYLIRLLEIRYEEDPDFRMEVPLRLLEETNIKQRARLPGGEEIEIAGRRAIDPKKGEFREWSFGEIAEHLDAGRDLDSILQIKRALDLAVDDGQPVEKVKPSPMEAPASEPDPPAVTTPETRPAATQENLL